MVVRTKRNYRNRIKEMYVFFSLNYKDYYDVGVQILLEEDHVSLDLFHYKNTHDLIYTGINVQMVKAFLAHKKQKANATLPARSNFASITMLFCGVPSRQSRCSREPTTMTLKSF